MQFRCGAVGADRPFQSAVWLLSDYILVSVSFRRPPPNVSRQCGVPAMYTRKAAHAVPTFERVLVGTMLHYMQQTEAATGELSETALRRVLPVQASGPWFCQLVGIMEGLSKNDLACI